LIQEFQATLGYIGRTCLKKTFNSFDPFEFIFTWCYIRVHLHSTSKDFYVVFIPAYAKYPLRRNQSSHINHWTDKQNVAYSYNGILFSNKMNYWYMQCCGWIWKKYVGKRGKRICICVCVYTHIHDIYMLWLMLYNTNNIVGTQYSTIYVYIYTYTFMYTHTYTLI
jgi:hypothetical protein